MESKLVAAAFRGTRGDRVVVDEYHANPLWLSRVVPVVATFRNNGSYSGPGLIPKSTAMSNPQTRSQR